MERFTRAIVRPPAPTFSEGLTTASLGVPDLGLALEQHESYARVLETCGLVLTRLAPDAAYPDSTFVEDTAVITGKGAILTRPGAQSRAGEVEAIRRALAGIYRDLAEIVDPGTVDGGDICEAGERVLIGLSHRTNLEGARQLADWLRARGLSSATIDVTSVPTILHLKSGLSYLGEGRMLVIEALAGHPALRGFELLLVPEGEEYAANAVRVNDHVLLPAGFPGVEARVRGEGYDVVTLGMSEFRKMDGGLSCLSLRF